MEGGRGVSKQWGQGGVRVVILGYGEMGHAFETLLRDRAELSIWQRQPPAGVPRLVLEKIASEADVLIFCLPAMAHEQILQRILPHLSPAAVCVSIAKGLDGQGRTVGQLFTDFLAKDGSSPHPYAFLYGPMIAEEIIAGRVGFAELFSSSASTTQRLLQLFKGSPLVLRENSDLAGCSWSVILKNVYALLFGMSDGLGLGDNMRGYLSVAVLTEFNLIVQALGGRSGTVYSLAGLGDLITTATSTDSHHHALGVQLARGDRGQVAGEGVHTLEMVVRYQLVKLERYPLFRLVYSVVFEAGEPAALLENYLTEIR